MQKPTKIYLLGMMGSGKTTLGRALADQMGIPFVDLDEAIITFSGQSIPELFETGGEDEFRRVESRLLRQFADSDDSFVMAAGGGTPCFGENLARMNNSGVTIFLNVPVAELVKRLENNRTDRPLISHLADLQLSAFLENLLQARLSCYMKAEHTLNGVKIGISDFQSLGLKL